MIDSKECTMYIQYVTHVRLIQRTVATPHVKRPKVITLCSLSQFLVIWTYVWPLCRTNSTYHASTNTLAIIQARPLRILV